VCSWACACDELLLALKQVRMRAYKKSFAMTNKLLKVTERRRH
jgi:hypothetical protein